MARSPRRPETSQDSAALNRDRTVPAAPDPRIAGKRRMDCKHVLEDVVTQNRDEHALHRFLDDSAIGASRRDGRPEDKRVPVVNLFVLLELSGRASATLKSHGIKVGFLGTELPEKLPTWFQPRTT